MKRLSRGRLLLRGATVATALASMVGVPIAALDEQRPARFGWHMYAGSVGPPTLEVTTTAGVTEDRELGRLIARYRPEITDYEPVARRLCADASVASVRLIRDYPSTIWEFSCEDF